MTQQNQEPVTHGRTNHPSSSTVFRESREESTHATTRTPILRLCSMHGFLENLHIYDDLVPHLAVAGRRVVTFDFLRFG
ncbi:MAG: Pimeloyl-ACP methyl ester carboxylesterase [Rhodospirillales bacterium]|nr:Pimeloyl-ACP methyl ester carboxylesterase [Rhodospirillales bacterium]